MTSSVSVANPHPRHQLERLALGVLLSSVVDRRLAAGSDGVERVERGEARLGKDDASSGPQAARVLPVNARMSTSASLAVPSTTSATGSSNPTNAVRGHGHFQQPDFAEECQGLAAVSCEGDLVDGAHGAGDGADVDGEAPRLAARDRPSTRSAGTCSTTRVI